MKIEGPVDESGPAMTVLVVYDGEGSLLVAKAAVEKSGHECIMASDGDTAWELWMKAGADDYVTKPLDPFVLHTRLLAARRVTTLHGALADAWARPRTVTNA